MTSPFEELFVPFFMDVNAIMMYKSHNIEIPPHLQDLYVTLMKEIPRIREEKQPKVEIYHDPEGDALVEQMSIDARRMLDELHNNYWVDVI